MYQIESENKIEVAIRKHADLVKRIAYHLKARLPDSVLIEDLIQAGMIGLIEAVQKYDQSKGASIETYAGIRIRGAMLDEMRRGDWVPRSVHKSSRSIAEAISIVEKRTGADAKAADVAQVLGVTVEAYNTMLKDVSTGHLFSLDEMLDSEDSAGGYIDDMQISPELAIENESFRARLASAIEALPEKEKLVLSLYYEEELNLKEIGLVLDVSESRVSQIHSQAAMRLRSRLR